MNRILLFIFSATLFCSSAIAQWDNKPKIEAWITNPDKTVLFEKQSVLPSTSSATDKIVIDNKITYQTIDGFGFTLTGGSAMHIYKMSGEARKKLLTELFAFNGNNIGISYLRISVGASDLDEQVFSYDDMPEGKTDPELVNFSLGYDLKYLVPLLKEIIQINPDIKLLGSPWSAPTWMKTNNSAIGGSLKPEFYDAYARYFIKYIQSMKAEGIRIDAITVQNEPLHPGNNPSMFMPAEQQAEFIKNHLGPIFKQNNITTKIIIYDHNADRTDYPITVLNDSIARKFVDGSAFHLYGGSVDDISKVHVAYPDKNLYFTEQWIGAPGNFGGDLDWHVETLIIGATRNWCRTVLEWNLAADENQNPHTDKGGCTSCLGAITVIGDSIIRNPAYYIVAHAAKFVRPGSVRINSNLPEYLPNVAFLTPEGKIVLIVINKSNTTKPFKISAEGKEFSTQLNSGAVGTYIF